MSAWHAPLPEPQLGDVVEITTPQGFAYAQFTHDIPLHEQLLRILPGLYATRPTDLAALVQQRERYVTFFWLRPALQKSRPVVTIVGQFPIPARNRAVPLFRTPALEPRDPGPPPYWTLWDGQRRWRVDRLTEGQRDLPVDGMPTTGVFLHQIVSGWSPRDYDGIPVGRTPPVAAGGSKRRPRQRGKRRLPRIGDVVELATPKGFAYAQFTPDIPVDGELLRILPGLYATRPADLAALVQQRERYVTFSMLRGLIRRDLATVVGQFEIPARNRPIPLFRAIGGPGRHPITGKLNCWWLMDEERRWRVEGLTAAQRGLPGDGIPSHPLLIDNIVSGWHPRDDVSAGEKAAAEPLPPQHVLYFPDVIAAQVARKRLHAQGYRGIAVLHSRSVPPSERASLEGAAAPPPDWKWLVVTYGERPPPPGLVEELAAQSQEALAAELEAVESSAAEAAEREAPPEHFLYFPTAAAAQEAARRLRAEGFKRVAARAPDSAYFADEEAPPGTHALGREWSVVASGTVPPPGDPIEDTRAHLEALAESLGGEYDA